jgi:hypothetical protein
VFANADSYDIEFAGLNRLTSGDDYDHGYGSKAWGLDALGNMTLVTKNNVTTNRAHNQIRSRFMRTFEKADSPREGVVA